MDMINPPFRNSAAEACRPLSVATLAPVCGMRLLGGGREEYLAACSEQRRPSEKTFSLETRPRKHCVLSLPCRWSILSERVLDGDFAVPERKQVAACNLDPPAILQCSGESPLGNTAVSLYKVPSVTPVGIRVL